MTLIFTVEETLLFLLVEATFLLGFFFANMPIISFTTSSSQKFITFANFLRICFAHNEEFQFYMLT